MTKLKTKQKRRRKELAMRKKQSWKAKKKIYACEECGEKQYLTRDHIKKKEHGGKDNKRNLRILCRKCHDKRHGMK